MNKSYKGHLVTIRLRAILRAPSRRLIVYARLLVALHYSLDWQ